MGIILIFLDRGRGEGGQSVTQILREPRGIGIVLRLTHRRLPVRDQSRINHPEHGISCTALQSVLGS
jgi:hypothetical protein